MDCNSNTHRGRLNSGVVTAIGFLGGCLVCMLVATRTLGWLLPYEYTGHGVDKYLHYLRLEFLSKLIAFFGGIMCAYYAASFQENGWRFSIRTLLIATTVISVLLGLIVVSS